MSECSACLAREPGYPHTCGITHRNFEVTFARPCGKCGGTKGRGTYEYRRGLIFKDTWVCGCGAVYYAWTWESTMIAAQECRAMEPKPSAPAPAQKGQMVLW